MAISGAHLIIYSADPDADRDFFRTVLQYPHVDAGDGWLIFKLPPAEAAIHPSNSATGHELYLMCDDLDDTMARLRQAGISFSEMEEARWGLLTRFILPGGSSIGLYDPRHPRATGL